MAHVLIVHNNLQTANTYCVILRSFGFDITTAASDCEAVELPATLWVDVVLVLQPAAMAALDVASNLRLNHLSRQMVIVGSPGEGSSLDGGATGGATYVSGPLRPHEVVDVVLDALQTAVVDSRVREIVRLIDADPANHWSVAALAGRVCLSDSRLRHIFAVDLRMTVTDYARSRRFVAAAGRLLTTFENVRQIAYAVGFGSQSLGDFRRGFRERFGMSPMQYRARYSQHRPTRNCGGGGQPP